MANILSLIISTNIKTIALVSLAVFAVIIYLYRSYKRGEIVLPKNKIVCSLLLVPISAVLSSLFSGNFMHSFFGDSIEVGTALSFVSLYVIFYMSFYLSLKGEGFYGKVERVFFGLSAISVLYLAAVTLMYYGVIPPVNLLPLSLLGNYFDTAVMISALVLYSVYALNFRALSKPWKIMHSVAIVLSFLVIGSVNFSHGIAILGIMTLALMMLKKSFGSISLWFTIALSALVFVSGSYFGSVLTSKLSEFTKIGAFDVRPNLSATLEIAKMAITKSPVFGAGPNMFTPLWDLYRPLEVNVTNFWGTSFMFGSGLLPTLFVTLGALGIISLAIFFILYISRGVKSFRVGVESNSSLYFLISLFFFAVSFFYTPGILVLFFAFVFAGLFASSIEITEFRMQFMSLDGFPRRRAKLIFCIAAVLLTIGAAYAEYAAVTRVSSLIAFEKAVEKFNSDNDSASAKTSIIKSAETYPNDSYYRSLAELFMIDIQGVITKVNDSGKAPGEEDVASFQMAASNAISAGSLALNKNRQNYLNYFVLGRVYETLAANAVSGASTTAFSAYSEAEKLAPTNPATQLGFARLASINGDVDGAKAFIEKAISLKSNYVDAYFGLAQVEAASNNVPAAIKAVEAGVASDPTNPNLYFQLGLIKYQTSDNQGAVDALQNAITLVPDYANAKYFLGLSYHKVGRNEEAIKQFEEISVSNPENKEVSLILANLKAGRDPFANAEPPIDDEPEKRSSPPLDD